MKKYTNSQKGFTPLVIVLIIVVVGLACGAGYYVWQKNQNIKEVDSAVGATTSTTPSPVVSPTPTEADETLGQKTYTSTLKKFSFKYPSDATIKSEVNKEYNTETVAITDSGKKIVVNILANISGGTDKTFTQSRQVSYESTLVDKKVKLTKISDQTKNEYQDMLGKTIPATEGYRIVSYASNLKLPNNEPYLFYSEGSDAKDADIAINLFENIVSSINFN